MGSKKRLMMVSSGGGHLGHLLWYRSLWQEHDVVWVVLPGPDVDSRLAGEQVVYAHGPTNRSLTKAVANARLARRLVREHQPDWVISAGAAIAVPFIYVARLHKIPTLFFEVCDRLERPSLSGRLVRPVSSCMAVFHPDQQAHYPDALLLQGLG